MVFPEPIVQFNVNARERTPLGTSSDRPDVVIVVCCYCHKSKSNKQLQIAEE